MTIEILTDIASWVLLSAGAFFVIVGAIGIMRMPDVFTRMHAAGILDTMGAGLILVGLMVQAGLSLVTLKLLVLLALFFFTSPVATHAVARAALHDGVEPILKNGGTKDGKSKQGQDKAS